MSRFFDPRYEQESIDQGIADRQQEVGFTVPWYFFDRDKTTTDPIYDEGSFGQYGLRWRGPYPMPVYQITRIEGADEDNGQGFYTVDRITVWLSYRQAVDAGLLPAPDQTDQHLKDRFIFDNKVWSPDSIISRNLLGGGGTRSMVIVQATQVRDDEMVDDPNFQAFAENIYPRA